MHRFQADYNNAQCEVKVMISLVDKADDTVLVEGKFKYKDGSTKKNVVLCTFRRKGFTYHRRTSTLCFHLNGKHVGANAQVNLVIKHDDITITSSVSRQHSNHKSRFRFRNRLSKTMLDKLTNSVV